MGDTAAVQDLLQQSCDQEAGPREVDKMLRFQFRMTMDSPLYAGMQSGSFPVCEALLAAKADPARPSHLPQERGALSAASVARRPIFVCEKNTNIRVQ